MACIAKHKVEKGLIAKKITNNSIRAVNTGAGSALKLLQYLMLCDGQVAG